MNDSFSTEIDYYDERVIKIREYRIEFEKLYNNFIKNITPSFHNTSCGFTSSKVRKSRIRAFSISNNSILLKENYNKISTDNDTEKFMLDELLILTGEDNNTNIEEKILFDKLLESMV